MDREGYDSTCIISVYRISKSGKTTLIKETLLDTGFTLSGHCCSPVKKYEDYDDDFLTKTNTALVTMWIMKRRAMSFKEM